MSKHRFYYCSSQIEDRGKCKVQCSHCKLYYKPLENEFKRVPRKLKKKSAVKSYLTKSEDEKEFTEFVKQRELKLAQKN